MCWTLNHQNILEMAQGHISLSNMSFHIRPHSLFFIQTCYQQVIGQTLLTQAHWEIGEKILTFLELFYDSTVALSGIYYPTSPLMLHHIIEIASHLSNYENDILLRDIVVPMKSKFLKYCF
jgi:hypothetical protein